MSFRPWTFQYTMGTARAQLNLFRVNLLNRSCLLKKDFFWDEFFWFTYYEKVWNEVPTGRSDSINTRQLMARMKDMSDEKRKIIEAVTTAQRKQRKVNEIEEHQRLVREARSTTSFLGGFISISAPSDPHLAVCKFLAGSDAPSIRDFARDFNESWFDDWEEPLKIWALSEIYYQAFPQYYLALCVRRAIAGQNYKFLSYLLVKTYTDGEDAIVALEETYKESEGGMALELAVGDWKELAKAGESVDGSSVRMHAIGDLEWYER